MWQDQFNLHGKGGTPVEIRLLLSSLEASERACSQERPTASCYKKALHSKNKVTKQPGTDTMARAPKKVRTEKHCNLCKKHGGTYTTLVKKDGTEKIRFLHRQERWKETQSTQCENV